ncbi:MAG: ABC transporter substrate-binding protein [Acidobacteria bacterium]|nr:ABC transporter substrate-binding protein [Acidobacteriota bacterium]MCI0717836.1 ABC transporter substrate-binding protein [Acidobacteriota bacterium]
MNSACLRSAIVSFALAGVCLNCGKEPTQKLSSTQAGPITGGELRLAAQSPESLDPILSNNYWESEIVLQLFDGLVRFDASLNTVSALAQDWRVSPDGKTYVFSLRRGVQFHNGREITAEDFVYSFTRLLDPKWKSNDSQYYSRIQGAADFQAGRSATVSGLSALNSSTLQIALDQPYAPFLRLLAQQPASVVPKEAVEGSGAPFGKNPIGSGAFRLERWDTGAEILLAANPSYYAGRPHLGAIRIATLPALNASESFQFFLDGKLDLSFVPPEQVALAQREPAWVFMSRPVLRLMYLGMNVRDRLMRDSGVRKAVVSAINKADLLGSDPDHGITHGLLPASLLGSNPGAHPDLFNPQAARDLLRRRQKQPLKLELWHAQVSDTRTALLARMAAQLESAGFAVEVKTLPSMAQLLDKIYAGKTQLFLLGEQLDFPDPDALLNRLFRSTSPANPFGYANSKVDALLLEAQKALDDNSRARLYGEIETLIMRDSPVLPLSVVKYSVVCHRRVQGLQVSPLGFQYLPLREVWLKPEN